MSAPVTTKASTLVELLADFGLEVRPNNAYNNELIKIDSFEVWGGVKNPFAEVVTVCSCTCFRLPDEEE